jgi:hypothetical protein
MKVKDIDFKALKEENSKKLICIILTVWELTKNSRKDFSSFTGLYNYITSHPRASEYLNSECEYTIQSTWNQHAQMEQATYEFRILLPKMDTGKVPYDKAYKHIPSKIPGIKDVIFNPPATIVFWEDRTKTVVKAQEDFDPEKGLAMAISKKMFGNNYGYYNVFQKWLKKWNKQVKDSIVFSDNLTKAIDNCRKQAEELTGSMDNLSNSLKEEVYCKNCEYYIPADKLNKTLYQNPLDADGACLATPEITYVDAFDTCDEGVRKIDKDE